MTMPLETNHTPEWLERFRVEPKAALDAMLRGLARIFRPTSGRHRRTSWTAACSGGCRRMTRICICSMRPCTTGSPPAAWTWTRNGTRNTAYHASSPRPWAPYRLPPGSAPQRRLGSGQLPGADPPRRAPASVRGLGSAAGPGPGRGLHPDRPAPTFLLITPVQGRRPALSTGYDRPGPEWPEQSAGH